MRNLGLSRRGFVRSGGAAAAAIALTAGRPLLSAALTRFSISADRAQRFDGFGLSQPLYDNFGSLSPKVQARALDFVYGTLPVGYFRTWLPAGAQWDVAKMISRFRTTYIDNQMLAKISERCQPQLILAPDTAGEGPSGEPSTYAAKVAQFIEELRKREGVNFESTSIVNEPLAYPTVWLAQAAIALRQELDSRGLQDTKIIAADWANVSYKSVQAISDFQADPRANAAIHAWSNHSYNMCSTSSMTLAARHKERWVTEAGQVIWDSYGTPAEVNVMDAANLAGRLLNDLNNNVTRWMYFIGFLSTTYPKAPSNPWCALVLTSPNGELTVFNRYYYLKQLLDTFPKGSVFYHTQSSLDGAMDWTYGQKPRMSAAAAVGPDGRLRVAVVNTTGILSNTISQYYPSQPFFIELELPKRFHARVTGIDGKTRSLGIVQSGWQLSSLTLNPCELATLVEI